MINVLTLPSKLRTFERRNRHLIFLEEVSHRLFQFPLKQIEKYRQYFGSFMFHRPSFLVGSSSKVRSAKETVFTQRCVTFKNLQCQSQETSVNRKTRLSLTGIVPNLASSAPGGRGRRKHQKDLKTQQTKTNLPSKVKKELKEQMYFVLHTTVSQEVVIVILLLFLLISITEDGTTRKLYNKVVPKRNYDSV